MPVVKRKKKPITPKLAPPPHPRNLTHICASLRVLHLYDQWLLSTRNHSAGRAHRFGNTKSGSWRRCVPSQFRPSPEVVVLGPQLTRSQYKPSIELSSDARPQQKWCPIDLPLRSAVTWAASDTPKPGSRCSYPSIQHGSLSTRE